LKQAAKKNFKEEKECDIYFKKGQLDKKDEVLSPRGVLTNNLFTSDRTCLSESFKKRHEKCLISDYNYYNDKFLEDEIERHYSRIYR
jgi:hypothetical protein